ncbi:MAG: phage integrase SAM-like domain-containing protein [Candidatus Sphingomonas colombiensis]|nr:phage integrase SAM-like domain-containing protein [Sphingomonas sp.]WEK43614.1 MAG: phage integrase SAM-like domain-containing protein [Sphingomonas sp.]
MAKITIEFLRAKKYPSGIHYYWEPSATLKAAGWQALKLGRDEEAAIRAARARNAEIAAWRAGDATPKDVKRIEKRHTVDAIIAIYREKRVAKLKEKTQTEYDSKLRVISRWAGQERMDGITLDNIRAFRDALYAPRKDGEIRATTAYNTLKNLRSLWAWAYENELIATNPAAKDLDISTPAPRQQFAGALARQALIDAAVAVGRPNMAAAIILAYTIGQREEDLLKLLQTRYNEIQQFEADDPAVYDRLTAREPDGRLFGIRVRQGKTDRWVGVPVTGDARVRLEAGVLGARSKGLTTILFDERRDQTWTAPALDEVPGKIWSVEERKERREAQRKEARIRQMYFQRSFAAIRAAAVERLRKAGDAELADEVADLQFRDLRRTCVVMMGERGIPDHLISAITGHKLETVKKILEVYLPRTTGMAMLAVDLSQARAPKQAARSRKSA